MQRPITISILHAAMHGALVTLALATGALAEVPRLPTAVAVPDSGKPPLSSATYQGTEYSDLKAHGYLEQEFYLQGVAPAITAAGQTLLEAPYTTRMLVRKPADPARFNGTVIIEPFSWFGERAAGWILTRDYPVSYTHLRAHET